MITDSEAKQEVMSLEASPLELRSVAEETSKGAILKKAKKFDRVKPKVTEVNNEVNCRRSVFLKNEDIWYKNYYQGRWCWKPGTIEKRSGVNTYIIKAGGITKKCHRDQLKKRYPSSEHTKTDDDFWTTLTNLPVETGEGTTLRRSQRLTRKPVRYPN